VRCLPTPVERGGRCEGERARTQEHLSLGPAGLTGAQVGCSPIGSADSVRCLPTPVERGGRRGRDHARAAEGADIAPARSVTRVKRVSKTPVGKRSSKPSLGSHKPNSRRPKSRPGPVQLSDSARSSLLETAVHDTLDLMETMFPEAVDGIAARRTRATELIRAGVAAVNNTFTESDALNWADGFEFPQEGLDNDLAQFLAADGDLEAICRARLEQLAPDRLNMERVNSWLSAGNPEIERMRQLAGTGMPIPVASDFVPNSTTGSYPPLRQTYSRLGSVVNRLLEDSFHAKGLAFILPKDHAVLVNRLHLSVNSWVPKRGKEYGRPIGDAADGGPGQTPLNSQEAKEAGDALWGTIVHPTIADLAQQINDFFAAEVAKDPSVKWSEVILYKMDLAGAYTLISFDPADVSLMAFELTEDRVMFFLCGIFGWCGTPAAFQVVTRACAHELAAMVWGRILMYVDDILGVCLRKDLDANLAKSKAFLTGLLGPGAVADHKTESGRRLTEIGFDIDLDRQLVEISEGNVAKALVGYLDIAADGRTDRRQMERLASWASRYGEICYFIRPFNRALYNSYMGHDVGHPFVLSEAEMRAVRIVRLLLTMTALEPFAFCRSLASFSPGSATVLVEFDASLRGIGLIWYLVDSLGRERPIGGLSVDISGLGFGEDSQYQNTAEFIAATLGILGLTQLGLEGSAIRLRGDSMSALCWASSLRFKGHLTTNAAVVFTLLLVQTRVTVVDKEHFSSEANVRTDELSRGSTVAEVARKFSNLIGLRELSFPDAVAQTLRDCDPRLELGDDAAFSNLWRRVGESRRSARPR
jgi:hypothetical protein